MTNPNPEHIEVLLKGKDFWNEWRNENPEIIPQLIWANLDHMDLSYFNLKDADLNGASLWGTNFSFANLENTNLQGVHADEAIFIEANLNDVQASGMQACNADFSNATMTNWLTYDGKLYDSNLTNANLKNSELSGCEFNNCTLINSYFENADLTNCNFTKANLEGANLKNTLLIGCLFVDAQLLNSDLSFANVYGVSTWNIKTNNQTIQKDLIITKEKEPKITLDNIKIAQFIYLLLQNEEIKDIIETVTSKAVLILGRFTPERKEKLEYTKNLLRNLGFAPIIFDFENPSNRSTLETITTLARLSKFIVADITDPKSIPQELVTIVESMPSVKVIPIIEKGFEPWGMYDHISKYPWVLPVIEYNGKDEIDDILLKQIYKIENSC